jgi:hypothetical protein
MRRPQDFSRHAKKFRVFSRKTVFLGGIRRAWSFVPKPTTPVMEMNRTRILLAVLLSASLSGHLAAQSTDTPAKPAEPKTTDEVLKLENFEVTDVPIEKQILPTARPFASVFGTDDNIIDVTRNVTIISAQQLKDISITDVSDFSKLTSSAYTTTNFGAPSNPSIRGQSADIFINGMRGRITSNGNGLPIDFNSVESVNIVKGPATAVQGASMYVGGFIDLITKQPYFDAARGSISATVGSYGKKSWTVDMGGPISKDLAYRFSYTGEDSNGFWHDYYQHNQSIYGAMTYRPNDHYQLFVDGTLNWYRYTENWGMNRPTQDLIDNGNYVTGINNNNAPGAPSDPQNSVNILGGGNSMAWGPIVQIDRHDRLLAPGNHSTGREFNAQAIQTETVSPEFKIVNNTFASYTARNTLSGYYYSEIVDPSWFAENRTEFIFEKKQFTVNAGLDLRYQRTKAYDDYFYEPANVWDITKDLSYVNVYNALDFASNGGFGDFLATPVPGYPNRYATPGVVNGDTNDSTGITVGPFVQGTWKFSDQWSLKGGAREDFLYAKVREPLGPLPSFLSPTPYPEDSINVVIPNINGSLLFKPTPNSSYYFTYNYSQNSSGAVGNGGGITGWAQNPDGTYYLAKDLFTQPSTLYEVGAKYSLVQNKLFLNFALYQQDRTAKGTSSTEINKFHSRGFEAELNYQPDKHVYATFSYSIIDATQPIFSQFNPFQSDGGTPLLTPSESFATGGTAVISGLPKNLFNGLFSYSFDSGWGFSANTEVTSPINNNIAGTLVIPWQYTIDSSIWYHHKVWDYRVNILNVTNEKNWAPPNSVYGNASILAMPGTQVQFTVKYNF